MTTAENIIDAAMNLATEAAEKRLSPADLAAAVEQECRELFGSVAGPEDPLWPLHVDVARQVLAAGGIPTGELTEWLAVTQRRDTPSGPGDAV